ncbi:MAG: signal peptidase I [Croceibacterium sp.]
MEPVQPGDPAKKQEGSFGWFLVKLVIAVLVFRTFIFTSFMIPSESMMPRLLEGDYLFAAKWPFGYSRASLPLDLAIVPPGRLFGRLPTRGDVLIFKHPVDRVDYVKRVIGLPGDRIEVVAGQVVLNGTPIPKRKIADFVLPIRPNERCTEDQFTETERDGSSACRYPRFHETLPNGVEYDVLDLGQRDADNFAPVTVPAGHLFMMGDNRDDSMDSRFPAIADKGVGFVPLDNVAGRASFMFFSTDGTAAWLKPWTWFTAARWSRIGRPI